MYRNKKKGFIRHYFSSKKTGLSSTTFSAGRKSSAGFTLIELLVVISIISLLSTIVFGQLNEARAKARDARRISDLKNIQLALELYWDDFGKYPNYDASSGGASSNKASDSNWGALKDNLEDYIVLPGDPLGGTTGGPWPWFGTGRTYYYLSNSDSNSNDYDLVTNLETEHNLICSNINYKRHANLVGEVPGDGWCDTSPAEDGNNNLYSVHGD